MLMKSTRSDSREKSEAGPGSFCIPAAAIHALLDAKADAMMICAYLCLAAGTEESGWFSTWSETAVRNYTGAGRDRARNAIDALAKIFPKGSEHPLVIKRHAWKEPIPREGDGYREKIIHVLPDFGEPLGERTWIGKALVTGVKTFDRPLIALKNAGDGAARLMLALYAANDLEGWAGIPPVGGKFGSLFLCYEPVSDDKDLLGAARLIRAKRDFSIASGTYMSMTAKPGESFWNALHALISCGLVYEVVVVLNRNSKLEKLNDGQTYSAIPNDAEPLYELDCRSLHGYKPAGEEGIGGLTARTAGDFGFPVALAGGRFDDTYAAIVAKGHPAMIAGIFRLRFRVSNPKNADVKSAWSRIRHSNVAGAEFIHRIRRRHGLEDLSGKGKPSLPIKSQSELSEPSGPEYMH